MGDGHLQTLALVEDLLLGLLELRDVEAVAHMAEEMSLRIEARCALEEYPAEGAVVTPQAAQQTEERPAVRGFGASLLAGLQIVRMQVRGPAGTLFFGQRPAGEFQPGFVEVLHGPVRA